MKKSLKDFPIIKVTDGEEILCVQRQHPVILLSQIFLLSIILFTIPISILLISYTLLAVLPLDNQILISYILLTTLSAFLVIELYTFMNWYYHFYIITNKTIVQRYAFRIGGPFSEAVFGENMHIQQIVRNPPNLIYDFLKIQDVSVYFHELERKDPFIFRSPQNSQEIEDLLQDLIIQSVRKRGSQIV